MEPGDLLPQSSNWFAVAVAAVTGGFAFLAAWVTTRRSIGRERIAQLEARLADSDRPLAPDDRALVVAVAGKIDRLYEAFIEHRAEVKAFIGSRPRSR